MPVINVTQKDINRQKQPDKGWHLAVLDSVEEAASKDKNSINWTFEFQIRPGDNNDPSAERYARVLCNSKAVGIVMIPLSCALLDIPTDQFDPMQIDTDKLLGKECYIEVIDELYEGKIVKKIANFAALSAKPPF